MIVDPPLFVGAVNVMTTLPLPAAVVTFVGAFGTVDGVKEDDDVEAADVPMPFMATTLNVYEVPFITPFTAQLLVGAVVVQLPAAIFPAVYAVATYPVIVDPRESRGSSQVAVADALPATAVTFRGWDGSAFIAAVVDAVDAKEVPAALVAVTLNV